MRAKAVLLSSRSHSQTHSQTRSQTHTETRSHSQTHSETRSHSQTHSVYLDPRDSQPPKLMFDFEKLAVYQRAKASHLEIMRWLVSNREVDSVTRDQLRRSSLSIALNIAEGSGRFSLKDRRNFFVIARSSVFEVAAIFDILKDSGRIGPVEFEKFYLEADELSRILFALIKKLEVSS